MKRKRMCRTLPILVCALVALPFLMGGCPDEVGGGLMMAYMEVAQQSLSQFEYNMFLAGLAEINRLKEKAESEGLTPAEERKMNNLIRAVLNLGQNANVNGSQGIAPLLQEPEETYTNANRPTPWGSPNQPWSRPATNPATIGLPAGATVVSVIIGNTAYSSTHDPRIPSDWQSRASIVFYKDTNGVEHQISWPPSGMTTTGIPRAQNFTPPNRGLIRNR